ncbi:MAG: hypothetical protein AB1295_04680 [Candidatus Micrarchaeota archaeon]
MKYLFGLAALVMLVTAGFAQGGDSAGTNKTQVFIYETPENPQVVQISVLSFAEATSPTGETASELMKKWQQDCANEGRSDLQTCVNEKAVAANSLSSGYSFNPVSVQGARVTVEYFNPMGNAYAGVWTPVDGCIDMEATGTGTSQATDVMPEYTYYYATCNVKEATSGRATTLLRARFEPRDMPLQSSTYEWEYSNPEVTVPGQFSQAIRDLVSAVSSGGGSAIGAGGSLPCMAVFMILGLLLASLYFSGKSPVSLLDITTPRLPTPKGVTASGQILAPFGYGEMKKTTGAKMAKGAAAAALSAKNLASKMRGDAELNSALATVKGQKGTAADRASGDVAQQKSVSEAFVVGARSAGFGKETMDRLAKLPYHWGDAEHKEAAQVLAALEKMGGRQALLGMTLRDYLYSMRTKMSLEAVTGHPELGKRSAFHANLSGKLGKFFGGNRYANLSGVVMAGTDSTVRSARIMGRMGKAMVTTAPELARASARTTMEVLGGKQAMERLKEKGKTSATAGWLAGQVEKHPSKVVVGSMFPVSDKMGHLYRTLRDETVRDEMRYVLRQMYKKFGMKFDVNAEELAAMGHKDVDILKRSNYVASAEMAHAEAEIRHILSNSAMSGKEKLAELVKLAEKNGAHLDHQMLAFSQRLDKIDASPHAEHEKLFQLQQLLEEQNKVKMAINGGAKVHDDAFVCHVGGESLREHQVWETMVLRTMVWDGENGYLRGGIEQELKSARLNVVNRLASLDPTAGMEHLPEHMRNPAELKKVAERNRQDLLSLFTDEGKQAFTQYSKGKSVNSASISEIVGFMYGGLTPRAGDIDKKTGRMTWRASDLELQLPQSYTLVDTKRHWVAGLDPRENFAIGQWVESRFTKSYVPALKQSIEAELNRMAGSASWTVEQRTQAAKKLWIADQLHQDMEQRFNSHFGQNAYGTTRETMRFYAGVVAGFMEKALEEKGLSNNHPDRVFLEKLDMTNPKHINKLRELMETHRDAYNSVLSKPMTYDDITRSKQAVVMLHEGGFAFYKKGMMLSDMDRVMAGETALRDDKGVMRKFIAEEVSISFGGRNDLMSQYGKLRSSKDVNDWQPFVQETVKWAKSGGYSYDKEKVLAAVLWQYGQTTHDYSKFWEHSAVSVQNKTHVQPVAPSPLRFFGADGHTMSGVIKPFRDIGNHMGDYVSKVALAAGGAVHQTSYDLTPVSSQMRMQSFRMANAIQSGQVLKGLTEEEKVAYRAAAAQHGAFIQVWQYAIDRNPWRMSSSHSHQQAASASFQFGPGLPFNVKDNLRAFMSKGEYASFMATSGHTLDFAGKVMRPYVGMIRGLQMSMQGYSSRWDATQDALRTWNYTEPRIHEAMQSLNPFSFKWGSGKTAGRIASLNKMGGSLEKHQLSGYDYLSGLRQAPQDIFLAKKGVYVNARTGDVNPGETVYDYRMTMKADAPMAEYLYRTKEGAFMYDKELQKAALDNTTRRTVSAEALAIKRDQEIRGFGIMQNSLFGWANPVAFLWHMPVPGFPQSLSPKEIVARRVARAKQGHGQSFGDAMRGMAESMGNGASRFFQPNKMSMVVYCPKCGMSNYRGSICKNPSCRQAQY